MLAGGGAYNFHLLMDFVSQETKEKLQNLILELSKIYPCTLTIYILRVIAWRGFKKLER